MKSSTAHILYLSAWYPHRYDAMSGLFVRKHAEAAGKYHDVTVLYIHNDKNIKSIEIIENQQNNINEIYVYYPERFDGIIRQIAKSFCYVIAFIKGYLYFRRKNGKPSLIHVNILTRTGLMGALFSKADKIPFIVTEHWSRYFANRNSYHGVLRKWLTKWVVKNAAAVLPVSKGLQKAMQSHQLYNGNYLVVNNVVDDFFFSPHVSADRKLKRILHVSCFDEAAKNIKGILRATKELLRERSDFELVLVGTGIDFDEVNLYASELGINGMSVIFKGELTPSEVAFEFYNSDFFVLFSNYENAPVVISESLICGKPVISSDVGGIAEFVDESNGLLIPAKDEVALKNAMDFMLDHFSDYNSPEIQSNFASKFSFDAIGKQLSNIYEAIINRQL